MHAPLLWLDLETTGLDEHTARLLEVGMILTDGDLNEVACIDVVLGWRTPHALEMPDIVREMHMASGLLDEVAASRMCLREAEDLLVAWVDLHDARNLYMAGSGVHFDRRWLRHLMPALAACFHYRNFDATTLRYFFDTEKEAPEHRVLGDLRQSIKNIRMLADRARAAGIIALPAASAVA